MHGKFPQNKEDKIIKGEHSSKVKIRNPHNIYKPILLKGRSRWVSISKQLEGDEHDVGQILIPFRDIISWSVLLISDDLLDNRDTCYVINMLMIYVYGRYLVDSRLLNITFGFFC